MKQLDQWYSSVSLVLEFGYLKFVAIYELIYLLIY